MQTVYDQQQTENQRGIKVLPLSRMRAEDLKKVPTGLGLKTERHRQALAENPTQK